MPAYRLLTTRHNPDGSMETPSIDIVLSAESDQDAIRQAKRFPLDGFVEPFDFAWLMGTYGEIIWSSAMVERRAAA